MNSSVLCIPITLFSNDVIEADESYSLTISTRDSIDFDGNNSILIIQDNNGTFVCFKIMKRSLGVFVRVEDRYFFSRSYSETYLYTVYSV